MIGLRRVLLLAAVVSVSVLALGGPGRTIRSSGTEAANAHIQPLAVDHEAVASARPSAERPVVDLRSDAGRLLLLAWIGVLFAAALRARTAGRTVELQVRGSGAVSWLHRSFDRGPPSFAIA